MYLYLENLKHVPSRTHLFSIPASLTLQLYANLVSYQFDHRNVYYCKQKYPMTGRNVPKAKFINTNIAKF